MKEDIETEFLIDIDKILTLKAFENIKNDLENYDYIFTTFSIEKDFVKEIKHAKLIELNPILTEKDIKKLENTGLTKNKKIKMSTLLKVILENSSDVNIKNLIYSLDEAFPEKIHNDIDKNRFSLGNFLKKENIGIIFHKLNTKHSQDNVLIAVNEKEICINGKKINVIILINSNYETQYKPIIYNFVKLFFLNNKFDFTRSTLEIYNSLLTIDS